MICEHCGQEIKVLKFSFLATAETKKTYDGSYHKGYVVKRYLQPENVLHKRWMIDLLDIVENMVIWFFEDDLKVIEELSHPYKTEWCKID